MRREKEIEELESICVPGMSVHSVFCLLISEIIQMLSAPTPLITPALSLHPSFSLTSKHRTDRMSLRERLQSSNKK